MDRLNRLFHHSLGAQRAHGVGLRGAARWQIARQRRRDEGEEADGGESERVGTGDSVEQGAEEATEGGRGGPSRLGSNSTTGGRVP